MDSKLKKEKWAKPSVGKIVKLLGSKPEFRAVAIKHVATGKHRFLCTYFSDQFSPPKGDKTVSST